MTANAESLDIQIQPVCFKTKLTMIFISNRTVNFFVSHSLANILNVDILPEKQE